ncbi:Glycosyl hydrolases family 16 [Jannaschia faecimaris]|uniref:Glycosyl hydrolases family 16 n=1 Tax=Jannaschia faecimaris TaxID=1244108 RepID=A0A1H3TVA4_9RHOB|nr:family 16 glycosylhydrolase [Jannaschia faecimaris]SDZ54140.1 Glycosyl hydrolases family 16 [Jannaschia faecimaris]
MRYLLRSALLLVALAGGWRGAAAAGPDLMDMVPIFEERFADGLNRHNGQRGLWSTLPRRGQLMTNAAEAVFLDRGVLPPEADVLMPELHEVTTGGLSLRSAALPDAVLPAVRARMEATGQGGRAEAIRYATAQITTAATWAQVYGYFEIRARIPRGKGRWPAFWMTFAGRGWPPEIDVFEAYGTGINAPTPKDGLFKTAVIFDAFDAEGVRSHSVDITNPYDPDGPDAETKTRGDRQIHIFGQEHRGPALEADIYSTLHTYAVLWGPEEIVFYFGTDRASLREIYRAPTPDDVHDPMYLIANDQFTARGGWWSPRPSALEEVLAPGNDFLIESITVMAPRPALLLDMRAGDIPSNPRSSVVLDTLGDDVIAPGTGFDLIELSGGVDEIRVRRGREGTVVSGFGPDDSLDLRGFSIATPAEALARLTQVGPDVWLSATATPFWPQSVIFRDRQVTDFSEAQFTLR